MDLSRRRFLQYAFGSGLLVAGTASSGFASVTSDIEKVKLAIPIPELPPSFEGYSIGFMSDIHLSVCSDTSRLEYSLELLRHERPDLVLLGGDFIWLPDDSIAQLSLSANAGYSCLKQYDYQADALYVAIAERLRSLEAKDGMYGVYGNHDGWKAPQACTERLREGNVTVLRNESVEIKRGTDYLRLIGLDDYWTGMPKLPALPPKAQGQEVRVLLAHNPDYFSSLLKKTDFEFDLGLAGHTHGGQIKLPLLGPVSYNVFDPQFGEGLVWYERAHIYTTRGIGEVVIPLRINCPPELTIITLTGA